MRHLIIIAMLLCFLSGSLFAGQSFVGKVDIQKKTTVEKTVKATPVHTSRVSTFHKRSLFDYLKFRVKLWFGIFDEPVDDNDEPSFDKSGMKDLTQVIKIDDLIEDHGWAEDVI